MPKNYSETPAKANRSDSARSLQKALIILEGLALYPDGVSIKQLSHDLSMNKSTICKILSTFKDYMYVLQDSKTQYYRLGPKLLYLSDKMKRSINLHAIANPILRELNENTRETINLAMYIEDIHNLVYIDTIDGNHKLRLTNTIGNSPNLVSSAVGKSLLAFLPHNTVEQILEDSPIVPRTKYSIRTKEELYKQLEITRRRGFSVSNEETIEGVIGIAAPIFGLNSQVTGAIAITGPKIRIPENLVHQYSLLIIQAAKKISQQLGNIY